MSYGRLIVVAGAAQQLVVALVAAVDRVRQVQVDDAALHEPRIALVLRLAHARSRRPPRSPSRPGCPAHRTVSARGRSAVSWLVMLALRVHEARCQNWRACVLARSWVTAIRSGSAAHGAPAPSATIG